ncbi:MAG: cytochrome c biogenesis protein CcdA [Acidobacteria bacterium]|nr:cytochrome c biogenesis protein CcdA [Acidobacteriota bacterium]
MLRLALSFAAGLLTALSPCVLPALPIVVGSAAASRRHGPLALAAGLVVAFTLVGLAIASAGTFLGISEDAVRAGAALMLVAAGIVLFSHRLQDALSRRLSPIASAAARATTRVGDGLAGQFAVGAMLGAVWSPCVGPTLGAAIGLAASGHSAGWAAALMLAFGLGSAAPLLAIAYFSRRMIARRGRLISLAERGKPLFGGALVLMGALVFLGVDKVIEAAVLARLPQWWIDLLASV